MRHCTAFNTTNPSKLPVTSHTVFIKIHATVSHLEHIKVIPTAWAGFLSNGGCKVNYTRHGAVCEQHQSRIG
jgi:hypothetical protein